MHVFHMCSVYMMMFQVLCVFIMIAMVRGYCHSACRNSSDVILTGVLSVGDVDMLEFYVKDHVIPERKTYKVELCGPNNAAQYKVFSFSINWAVQNSTFTIHSKPLGGTYLNRIVPHLYRKLEPELNLAHGTRSIHILDDNDLIVDAYGVSNLPGTVLRDRYDLTAWYYYNNYAYRDTGSEFRSCRFDELEWMRGPDGNLGIHMMAYYPAATYRFYKPPEPTIAPVQENVTEVDFLSDISSWVPTEAGGSQTIGTIMIAVVILLMVLLLVIDMQKLYKDGKQGVNNVIATGKYVVYRIREMACRSQENDRVFLKQPRLVQSTDATPDRKFSLLSVTSFEDDMDVCKDTNTSGETPDIIKSTQM